jgi:hypothetical protein
LLIKQSFCQLDVLGLTRLFATHQQKHKLVDAVARTGIDLHLRQTACELSPQGRFVGTHEALPLHDRLAAKPSSLACSTSTAWNGSDSWDRVTVLWLLAAIKA